ncbi:MAG: TIGR03667 family PPOX class F420-dependent oxidoreductase [Chloroflexi bacterium]|nr:TIGR03667 family PPOX class F420-dependent oxidoreductase [Chloroflexota bacterium]
MIDKSTEYGQRVHRRLGVDRIIWLTTLDSKNMPQPKPVWFLWDGETFLIFTRPNGYKINHIKRNPHVSLNLDGDGAGGDIIVINGVAELVTGEIPAAQLAAYVEKYETGFTRINMTPDQFKENYKTAIRIRPLKVRGH